MWRGRDRSRGAGPQYGRTDRAAMPYDRHPPPDQYFERIRAEPHYPDNHRGPPQFHGDGGYVEHYDRVDAYMMQPQGGFHPREVPYGGRPRDVPGPHNVQRPGRIPDRGPRLPVQQQRGPKGASFGAPHSGPQRAGHELVEKNRLPQEAYIKRQSMRWLIKQRMSQVRKAINALEAAKAQRTDEGKRIMAKPLPGFMMGDVKTDFELTFGQTFAYSELGYKKLREVLVGECADFLKPPADQYIMEKAEGSSKIAGAEHRAASKCKLPSGKMGRPDLVPGLSSVVSKALRYCGYSQEDIEKQVAAAIAARTAGAAGTAQQKGDASGSKGKGAQQGAAAAAAAKGDSALEKSNANVMGVQSDDDMDDVILVEDDEEDDAMAAKEPAGNDEAAAVTAEGVEGGARAEGETVAPEDGSAAAAQEAAPMDADAVEVPAEGDTAALASQETCRIAVPADPNKVHASVPSTFWDSSSSLDMSPALRDFIGTVRTKISHFSCETLLPCPFSPALHCPPSAAPVGWNPDVETSEHFKVVRRLRVNEVPAVPMDKGCAREALDAANLLPTITPPHQRKQKVKGKLKDKAIWTNACDVSDLLEYSYADCLIMAQQNPEAECAECIPEIEDAIKANPEWLLGLAALPLLLRKIPDASDPESARYIVVQQEDRAGPDVCASLRRLRQAVVVCMLDAVPSVRSIMSAESTESPVMALGEPPDDLPCLRAATVTERIEKLLGKELLKQLLTAVRCETLEVFIDSVHCCDLVCRMPHPDEPALVLCSRFSPLGDLRNSLDMRLRRIATELTEKAAAKSKAGASATAAGEEAADVEEKQSGIDSASNAKGEQVAATTKRERQRMKRWGTLGKKAGSGQHSFRLLALLRDHQLMWGYGFQPLFCGASSLSETVSVFLPDMVVNGDAGADPSAPAIRWVNVSPETLMRYLIQDHLQQAEIAMVDAEKQNLLTDASEAGATEEKSEANIIVPQGDSEMIQNQDAAPEEKNAEPVEVEKQAADEEQMEGEGDDATDDDVAVVTEPTITAAAGESLAAGVKEELQATDEGNKADSTAEHPAATEGAKEGGESAAAEAAVSPPADQAADDSGAAQEGEVAGEQGTGAAPAAGENNQAGAAAADAQAVEKHPEAGEPAAGELHKDGPEGPAAGADEVQEMDTDAGPADIDQNAQHSEGEKAKTLETTAPADCKAAEAAADADIQERQQDEGPSVTDAADANAAEKAADDAATGSNAIVPVAGKDGVLQVRATIEGLRTEYKAKYGQEHPAKTDDDFVASLNSLRWLFHVTWDQQSGCVTIGEIPQKLDFVADVCETHSTKLMEFLDKALVKSDSSVLHSFTAATEVANTAPAEPSPSGATAAAKEKGSKETVKGKAASKAAAEAKQATDTDKLDVVIKEERVEDASQAAAGRTGDQNKGASTSAGAKKGAEGAEKEQAAAKRKAATTKEKAPEKRHKATTGAAATQASDGRGTKGALATSAAPGGRKGGAAGAGVAAKSNTTATAGRRGPFADPGPKGQRGTTQGGSGASAAGGGVRGPFSSNTSGANANRRGGGGGGGGAASQGGPGSRGGAGNSGSVRGGPVGSGAAAGANRANARNSDTIRGSMRGRTTFEPAPRVSTLGEGRLDARRGASAGRMPQSRGGPMGGSHRDPRVGPREPPFAGSGGMYEGGSDYRGDRSRSRGDPVAGSRYGGSGPNMHAMGAYDSRSMHVEDELSFRGRNAGRGNPGRDERLSHGPAPGAYSGSTYRSNAHAPGGEAGRRMHADDVYGMHEQGIDPRGVSTASRMNVSGGRSDYADYATPNHTNHTTTNSQQAYSVVPTGVSQPPPGVQYTEARLPDGQIIQVMLPAAAQDPNVLEPSDSRIYGATTTRYQVAQEPTYVTQVVQQPNQAMQGGTQRVYSTAVQDSTGVAVGGYMHDMHEGGHGDYVDEPVGHALDAKGRAAMLAYGGAGAGMMYEDSAVQRTVSGQQYSAQV